MTEQELKKSLEYLIEKDNNYNNKKLDAIDIDEMLKTITVFEDFPTNNKTQEENDQLRSARRKLIDYLEDRIHACKERGEYEDYLRADVYSEILIIVEGDNL